MSGIDQVTCRSYMSATRATERTNVLRCAGVPILHCSPLEAANLVIELSTTQVDRGADVHLCNAYTLAFGDAHPGFRSMLQRARVNFPDGKAVVWANRALYPGTGIPRERVYGPNLFLDVFSLGQTVDLRHYLIGGTPPVLDALRAELRERYPSANIVGAESPPFRTLSDVELDQQVARIADSKAQVVWLGLGTPKQDWEAARLAKLVPACFCAVGAAFDFIAGTKRQAPEWIQQRGFEWLYRLLSEPRRLWKRYLFGNVRFLFAVALSRKGRRQDSHLS